MPELKMPRSNEDQSTSTMLAEAREAPRVVAKLLARNAEICHELGRVLRRSPPAFVATCARGSSDNAATYAKYLLELRLGLVTASVGPSISSIYSTRPNFENCLFIAISQSGRSPDLLKLTEAAAGGGALTVALTNDEHSPLARIVDTIIPLHAGPEHAVPVTKTFIASLAAIAQLVACCSEDPALLSALEELPDALGAAASSEWLLNTSVLSGAKGLYVVGRGIGLGAAQEIALKLKEAAHIHAEAFSGAELLHGPITLAGEDFPVIVLSQNDETLPSLKSLIEKLVSRRVPIIALGPAMNGSAHWSIEASVLEPVLMAQSSYSLIDLVARNRGCDPDKPIQLRKVTESI